MPILDTNDWATFGWIATVCAIIAAKWAGELGFSQLAQLCWAMFALILPPVALLALYVRWLYRQKTLKAPAARWA